MLPQDAAAAAGILAKDGGRAYREICQA